MKLSLNPRRVLLAFIAVAMSVATAMANYSVYSYAGNVKIKQDGKIFEPKKGTKLKPADFVIMEKEARIQILDSRTSRIYTSETPGQTSVTRLMLEAMKQAQSNSRVVNYKIRIGKNSADVSDVVYLEKGKVTRALESYDPAADQLQIDAASLARQLYCSLVGTSSDSVSVFPLDVEHSADPEKGIRFRLTNTLDFPVYFNVLKIKDGIIDISSVGQPVGCYVVQPSQAFEREAFTRIDEHENNLLIMVPYYFNTDRLIECINDLVSRSPSEVVEDGIPLYLKVL